VCKKLAHLKEGELVHRHGSVACVRAGCFGGWRRGPKRTFRKRRGPAFFEGFATTKLKARESRRHGAGA
jgi:hypothetical protein